MFVDRDQIIKLLGLKRSGSRGWMMGACVYCGKPDHLGIIFGPIISFKCFRCGEHGTIFKLLSHIKRFDLVRKSGVHKTIPPIFLPLRGSLTDSLSDPLKEVIKELPDVPPPVGFKRIYSSPYLEGRGFTSYQFELFPVGTTTISPKWRNRLIFLVINGGRCKGYLGRLTLSKEEIDKRNDLIEDKKKKIVRYRNSDATDFGSMLFGYDEITLNTTTVILVEGITDKFNVDRVLNLYESEYVKCCVTFGKSISEGQMLLLIDKKLKGSLNEIIILYDYGTVKDSKNSGADLLCYFTTTICHISEEDKDPGDFENGDELLELIGKAEDPVDFYLNKLPKPNLV